MTCLGAANEDDDCAVGTSFGNLLHVRTAHAWSSKGSIDHGISRPVGPLAHGQEGCSRVDITPRYSRRGTFVQQWLRCQRARPGRLWTVGAACRMCRAGKVAGPRDGAEGEQGSHSATGEGGSVGVM